MLDRRQVILGGAVLVSTGGMRANALDARAASVGSLRDLYARVPDYSGLLTWNEVQARTRELAKAHPQLVSVRPIGRSKQGEPIELVSVGRGSHSALVVGGLHANEPIGSLTIEFLIDQLATREELRNGLDYTWHFIKSIDPDGMRLNEAWFKGSRSPAAYFRDFFRPALNRQAEYTFPLQVDSVSFQSSPPENLAWQRAIDLTRPQFLYTLHNAEYGGAFFLTSRDFPALERELESIPHACGVQINPLGEAFPGVKERGTGIFSLPEPRAIIGAARANKQDPADAWPAGDSSTSYVSRFGTFCFSAEVPYWDDARVFDRGPSDITLRRIYADQLARLDAGTPIIERWAPKLPAQNAARAEILLFLTESLAARRQQIGRLRAAMAAGKIPEAPLNISEAALHAVPLRLASLRPFTALARLARAEGAAPTLLPEAAGIEVEQYIEREIAAIQAEADLRTIPLRSLVGIQAISGLIAAQMLAGGKGQ